MQDVERVLELVHNLHPPLPIWLKLAVQTLQRLASHDGRFVPDDALEAALALSIAFNELATNAVKYGALSNAVGSILIGWTMEMAPAGKRLLLNWTEKGGPQVTPPARKGFGSRVLECGLTHELEGTVHLDYRPAGLVCTMDIPLPKGTRDG